jgi:thymidine phosphorylase
MGTLEAVRDAHRQVVEAQGALHAAVEAARERGRTWQEIGEVMGTSRQAAFQRFGRPPGAPVGEPADAAERALALLRDVVAGRFERARSGFDEVMLREVAADQLAEVWAMVVGMNGPFERFGEPVVHVPGSFTVVDVLLHFEAGEASARVSFRREGTVAGLYIRPVEGLP